MSEKQGFDAQKTLDKIRGDRNLSIIAVGAIAVIIGLFLPWYSIEFLGFSTSASPGLSDSTGILLLVFSLAAVAASTNVFNQDERNMSIATIVAGVLCALIMFNNWPDNSLGDIVTVGLGYWLGLAGSLAMVAGGAMRFKAGSDKKPSAKKTAEDK